MTNSRTKKTVLMTCGVVLSIAFGVLAFRQVDGGELWTGIQKINPLAFVLYFLIRSLNFILPGLRSKIFFRSLASVSLWVLIKSHWLAFAINNVVPLRAGEIARVVYLKKRSKAPTASVLTIVAFERILDMLGLLLLVLFVVLFWSGDLPLGSSVFLVSMIVCLLVIALLATARFPEAVLSLLSKITRIFGPKMEAFTLKLASSAIDGIKALGSFKNLAAVFLLTLGFWGVAVAMVSMWIWAFDIQASWIAPFLMVVCLSFGTALPAAPGHVGIYHWIVVQSFMLVDVSKSAAAPYAVVVHAMEVLPYTLLAIPFFYGDIVKMLKKEPDVG